MQISAYVPRSGRRSAMKYVVWIFAFFTACMILCSPSLAQRRRTAADMDKPSEPYRESALRRFEIVFTASIPFSAIHSYLTVRSVEMIRQSKVSPRISSGDWRAVGGLTVLFSGFIAFWDYLHTRGEDIQDRSFPRDQTDPLAMLTPVPGAGYTHQIIPREPMVRLLSMKF